MLTCKFLNFNKSQSDILNYEIPNICRVLYLRNTYMQYVERFGVRYPWFGVSTRPPGTTTAVTAIQWCGLRDNYNNVREKYCIYLR